MHLVIVHGYLLGAGSGSNVYTLSIAKAWKKQGHAVTIVCQDRSAKRLKCIDECIAGTDNIPLTRPRAGRIRVIVPDINGLLLVYWYNPYEGFDVKTLVDCSLNEIEENIKLTSAGLKKVIAQGVDKILANHSILSPVITKRATDGTMVPYDVKIHGSGLIFSVKKRHDLKAYAIEGITGCQKLIVGTTYMARFIQEIFQEDIVLEAKLIVIPPGMDPDIFQAGGSVRMRQEAFLKSVGELIKRKSAKGRRKNSIILPEHTIHDLDKALRAVVKSYEMRTVDADLCNRWQSFYEDEPIICYFGSFQDTKGVGEILVATPNIIKRFPKARLLMIGCGENREHLEGMVQAMVEGNYEAFLSFAKAGNFIDLPPNVYEMFDRISNGHVTFTGMLEHDQLKEILPACSISITCSKCLESFGMVSVEAMSAGVLPLCHDHTGISDVILAIQNSDPELAEMVRVDVRPGGKHKFADGAYLIKQLPDKIEKALRYLYPNGFQDHTRRREVSAKLREIAIKNFSWDDISKRILK